MEKKQQEWMLTYMAIGGLAGMCLGLGIVYLIEGTFSLGVLLGILTAAGLTIVFNIVKVMAKKDKTPETDERTRQNIIKFYAYFSHAFLGLVFLLLGIGTFMDVQNVSIAYLWVFMMVYIFTSGFGAMWVKRR